MLADGLCHPVSDSRDYASFFFLFLFSVTSRMSFFCSPYLNLKHNLTEPLYLIILPVSFTWPLQKAMHSQLPS